jgi:hypothetical protein
MSGNGTTETLSPAQQAYAEAFALAVEAAQYIQKRQLVANWIRKYPANLSPGAALTALRYWDFPKIPGVGTTTAFDVTNVVDTFLGRDRHDQAIYFLLTCPTSPDGQPVVDVDGLVDSFGEDNIREVVRDWARFACPGDQLAWDGGHAVVLSRTTQARLVWRASIESEDEVAADADDPDQT